MNELLFSREELTAVVTYVSYKNVRNSTAGLLLFSAPFMISLLIKLVVDNNCMSLEAFYLSYSKISIFTVELK